MNPAGRIGPRGVGAFAFAASYVVQQLSYGPARRVMRLSLGNGAVSHNVSGSGFELSEQGHRSPGFVV